MNNFFREKNKRKLSSPDQNLSTLEKKNAMWCWHCGSMHDFVFKGAGSISKFASIKMAFSEIYMNFHK